MSQNQTPNKIDPLEARKLLWKKGNITYLLDSNQLHLFKAYQNSPSRIVVWGCSRQLGKSYTLCTIAIQTCLQAPNTIVKFAAPTQKMVKTIIRPIMRQLLKDCPPEVRPEHKVADGMYVFPNGSEIQLSGCDAGRAENIRGGKAHLILIDECGFIDDLEYIINSILLPTTTTTKGKIILASTPPKSADHPFVKFLRRAEIEGSYVHKTVYDNPRLSEDDINELAKAVGGKESINFKREYLAQIIKDESSAIVPEFTEELKQKIVKHWPRPPFFDAYLAMDLGLKDLTVVLFAYYDFRNDKLIIEDEFVINGQKFTTAALADAIKKKEQDIFSDPFTGEFKEPYKRVSDNNLIVINDLYQLHGLLFFPTRKDDADAALNNLRMLIAAEKIIISPNCSTLIRHLENGTWNKSKKSFDRSEDNGHFDAIDSLKYLVRNVDFTKNPYPANYGLRRGEDYFQYRVTEVNNNANSIKHMVGIKRR